MPRVENLGNNVNEWYQNRANGNGSSTWDVCRFCYGLLLADPHIFDSQLVPYNGDPPGDTGRGGDVEHPAYDEPHYVCAVCHLTLQPVDEIASPLKDPESVDPWQDDNSK